MELNIVARALVGVLVWGMNNVEAEGHLKGVKVDELAELTEVDSNQLHHGLKTYNHLFVKDMAVASNIKFIGVNTKTYYGRESCLSI